MGKMLLNAIHGSNLKDRPRRSDAIPKHKRHKSDCVVFQKNGKRCPKNARRCPKKCKAISALSRYLPNRAWRADNQYFICSFGAPSIGDTLSHANWTLVRKISDTVRAALWALVAAWIVMFVISFPRIVDAHRAAQRQLLQQISDENSFYCEKWGMKTGTHEHTLCTLDLQEIRAHEGARIASDLTW